MRSWLIVVPALFLTFISALAQRSEDELNQGIAAYKENRYEQAAEHFEKAAELDPANIKAHMYLATTYVSQYIPGVDSDDNKEMADKAIAHYLRVLDLNASSEQRINSAKGIAYLYLNMKNWDDARKYYQMASDMDPNDPEPHYSIGVIDWTQCYRPRMEARVQLNIPPGEHLSAKKPEQKKVCDELRAKNESIVEDGMNQLDKAIQLRPNYDDAMAYLNLMYRERADLECDDLAARNRDLKTADEWVDKALAAKKANAEKVQGVK